MYCVATLTKSVNAQPASAFAEEVVVPSSSAMTQTTRIFFSPTIASLRLSCSSWLSVLTRLKRYRVCPGGMKHSGIPPSEERTKLHSDTSVFPLLSSPLSIFCSQRAASLPVIRMMFPSSSSHEMGSARGHHYPLWILYLARHISHFLPSWVERQCCFLKAWSSFDRPGDFPVSRRSRRVGD